MKTTIECEEFYNLMRAYLRCDSKLCNINPQYQAVINYIDVKLNDSIYSLKCQLKHQEERFDYMKKMYKTLPVIDVFAKLETAHTENYTDSQRLEFLHSSNLDDDGYEYGVARVKFVGGVTVFLWSLADHSDIDKLMKKYGVEPSAVQTKETE